MAARIDPETWDKSIRSIKVPDAFRLLVIREIAEAENRVAEMFDLAGYVRGTFTFRHSTARKRGLCIGCLCFLDDKTEGCINCSSRHSMRKLSQERRVANAN